MHVFLHILANLWMVITCVMNAVGPISIQAIYVPMWNQSTGHQVMIVDAAENLSN